MIILWEILSLYGVPSLPQMLWYSGILPVLIIFGFLLGIYKMYSNKRDRIPNIARRFVPHPFFVVDSLSSGKTDSLFLFIVTDDAILLVRPDDMKKDPGDIQFDEFLMLQKEVIEIHFNEISKIEISKSTYEINDSSSRPSITIYALQKLDLEISNKKNSFDGCVKILKKSLGNKVTTK